MSSRMTRHVGSMVEKDASEAGGGSWSNFDMNKHFDLRAPVFSPQTECELMRLQRVHLSRRPLTTCRTSRTPSINQVDTREDDYDVDTKAEGDPDETIIVSEADIFGPAEGKSSTISVGRSSTTPIGRSSTPSLKHSSFDTTMSKNIAGNPRTLNQGVLDETPVQRSQAFSGDGDLSYNLPSDSTRYGTPILKSRKLIQACSVQSFQTALSRTALSRTGSSRTALSQVFPQTGFPQGALPDTASPHTTSSGVSSSDQAAIALLDFDSTIDSPVFDPPFDPSATSHEPFSAKIWQEIDSVEKAIRSPAPEKDETTRMDSGSFLETQASIDFTPIAVDNARQQTDNSSSAISPSEPVVPSDAVAFDIVGVIDGAEGDLETDKRRNHVDRNDTPLLEETLGVFAKRDGLFYCDDGPANQDVFLIASILRDYATDSNREKIEEILKSMSHDDLTMLQLRLQLELAGGEKAKLTKQNHGLESKHDSFMNDHRSLTTRHDALQKQYDSLIEEHNSLQMQNNRLFIENHSIGKKNENLKDLNHSLVEEVTILRNQITDLTTRNVELERRNGELKSRNDGLQKANRQLESTVRGHCMLEREVQSLVQVKSEQVVELADHIGKLNEKIQEYQSYVEHLRSLH